MWVRSFIKENTVSKAGAGRAEGVWQIWACSRGQGGNNLFQYRKLLKAFNQAEYLINNSTFHVCLL